MLTIMDMPLEEAYAIDGDVLTESKFHDALKKAGLHLGKSKGLIQHLQAAGKGLFKMFIAGIKGDKAELKAVASTVKKEDVIDFLLKLDQATLHLITGPLHFIEAVTGWHLWAAVQAAKSTSKDVAAKIKSAIAAIKDGIQKMLDHGKTKVHLKNLARLETEIGKAI
jgi:hypothetical protein